MEREVVSDIEEIEERRVDVFMNGMLGWGARLALVMIAAAATAGCGAPREEVEAPAGEAEVVSDAEAMRRQWPPLPTSGFITGRPATAADVAAGNAAFVAQADGEVVGEPLDIAIPQHAVYVNPEDGKRTLVFIIQAERHRGREMLGYREIVTGRVGVAMRSEFVFLDEVIKEMEAQRDRADSAPAADDRTDPEVR